MNDQERQDQRQDGPQTESHSPDETVPLVDPTDPHATLSLVQSLLTKISQQQIELAQQNTRIAEMSSEMTALRNEAKELSEKYEKIQTRLESLPEDISIRITNTSPVNEIEPSALPTINEDEEISVSSNPRKRPYETIASAIPDETGNTPRDVSDKIGRGHLLSQSWPRNYDRWTRYSVDSNARGPLSAPPVPDPPRYLLVSRGPTHLNHPLPQPPPGGFAGHNPYTFSPIPLAAHPPPSPGWHYGQDNQNAAQPASMFSYPPTAHGAISHQSVSSGQYIAVVHPPLHGPQLQILQQSSPPSQALQTTGFSSQKSKGNKVSSTKSQDKSKSNTNSTEQDNTASAPLQKLPRPGSKEKVLKKWGSKIAGLELVWFPNDERWVPMYSFQDTPDLSFQDVYTEYNFGLNGLISIQELDVHYGTSWRISRQKNEYSRRRKLARFIRKLGERHGVDKACEEMSSLFREQNKAPSLRIFGDLLVYQGTDVVLDFDRFKARFPNYSGILLW